MSLDAQTRVRALSLLDTPPLPLRFEAFLPVTKALDRDTRSRKFRFSSRDRVATGGRVEGEFGIARERGKLRGINLRL